MKRRAPRAVALAAVILGASLAAKPVPAAPKSAHPKSAPRKSAPRKSAAPKSAPAKRTPRARGKPAPPVKPEPPLAPLAILPSIARVKVTSYEKKIVVVEEVNLPRGDWKGEALAFYVAFGAPGPRAIDAHLVPVRDGALEPDDDQVGEALSVERVARRPPRAHPLLGRDTMAGVVVLVPADALRAALEGGNMASLRIRSLVDATDPDPSGARSVVVRLGAAGGTPLTLGRIVAKTAAPSAPLARVEAHLCGPDADPLPLAVGTTPRIAHAGAPPIAPVLAVRHATDDLCVRLWHTQGPP